MRALDPVSKASSIGAGAASAVAATNPDPEGLLALNAKPARAPVKRVTAASPPPVVTTARKPPQVPTTPVVAAPQAAATPAGTSGLDVASALGVGALPQPLPANAVNELFQIGPQQRQQDLLDRRAADKSDEAAVLAVMIDTEFYAQQQLERAQRDALLVEPIGANTIDADALVDAARDAVQASGAETEYYASAFRAEDNRTLLAGDEIEIGVSLENAGAAEDWQWALMEASAVPLTAQDFEASRLGVVEANRRLQDAIDWRDLHEQQIQVDEAAMRAHEDARALDAVKSIMDPLIQTAQSEGDWRPVYIAESSLELPLEDAQARADASAQRLAQEQGKLESLLGQRFSIDEGGQLVAVGPLDARLSEPVSDQIGAELMRSEAALNDAQVTYELGGEGMAAVEGLVAQLGQARVDQLMWKAKSDAVRVTHELEDARRTLAAERLKDPDSAATAAAERHVRWLEGRASEIVAAAGEQAVSVPAMQAAETQAITDVATAERGVQTAQAAVERATADGSPKQLAAALESLEQWQLSLDSALATQAQVQAAYFTAGAQYLQDNATFPELASQVVKGSVFSMETSSAVPPKLTAKDMDQLSTLSSDDDDLTLSGGVEVSVKDGVTTYRLGDELRVIEEDGQFFVSHLNVGPYSSNWQPPVRMNPTTERLWVAQSNTMAASEQRAAVDARIAAFVPTQSFEPPPPVQPLGALELEPEVAQAGLDWVIDAQMDLSVLGSVPDTLRMEEAALRENRWLIFPDAALPSAQAQLGTGIDMNTLAPPRIDAVIEASADAASLGLSPETIERLSVEETTLRDVLVAQGSAEAAWGAEADAVRGAQDGTTYSKTTVPLVPGNAVHGGVSVTVPVDGGAMAAHNAQQQARDDRTIAQDSIAKFNLANAEHAHGVAQAAHTDWLQTHPGTEGTAAEIESPTWQQLQAAGQDVAQVRAQGDWRARERLVVEGLAPWDREKEDKLAGLFNGSEEDAFTLGRPMIGAFNAGLGYSGEPIELQGRAQTSRLVAAALGADNPAVVAQIEKIGGPDATVTLLPAVFSIGGSGLAQTVLFKVMTDGSAPMYVDDRGWSYNSLGDFRANNALPADSSMLVMPKDGNYRVGADGDVVLDFGDARTETGWENIRRTKHVDEAAGVAMMAGGGIVFLASHGTGAPVSAGMVAAGQALLAGGMVYTVYSSSDQLYDMGLHGQDLEPWKNPAALSAELDLGTSLFGLGAMGRGLSAGRMLTGRLDDAGAFIAGREFTAAEASVFARRQAQARVLGWTSEAFDAPSMVLGVKDLYQNWDHMSGGQQVFGAIMTGGDVAMASVPWAVEQLSAGPGPGHGQPPSVTTPEPASPNAGNTPSAAAAPVFGRPPTDADRAAWVGTPLPLAGGAVLPANDPLPFVVPLPRPAYATAAASAPPAHAQPGVPVAQRAGDAAAGSDSGAANVDEPAATGSSQAAPAAAAAVAGGDDASGPPPATTFADAAADDSGADPGFAAGMAGDLQSTFGVTVSAEAIAAMDRDVQRQLRADLDALRSDEPPASNEEAYAAIERVVSLLESHGIEPSAIYEQFAPLWSALVPPSFVSQADVPDQVLADDVARVIDDHHGVSVFLDELAGASTQELLGLRDLVNSGVPLADLLPELQALGLNYTLPSAESAQDAAPDAVDPRQAAQDEQVRAQQERQGQLRQGPAGGVPQQQQQQQANAGGVPGDGPAGSVLPSIGRGADIARAIEAVETLDIDGNRPHASGGAASSGPSTPPPSTTATGATSATPDVDNAGGAKGGGSGSGIPPPGATTFGDPGDADAGGRLPPADAVTAARTRDRIRARARAALKRPPEVPALRDALHGRADAARQKVAALPEKLRAAAGAQVEAALEARARLDEVAQGGDPLLAPLARQVLDDIALGLERGAERASRRADGSLIRQGLASEADAFAVLEPALRQRAQAVLLELRDAELRVRARHHLALASTLAAAPAGAAGSSLLGVARAWAANNAVAPSLEQRAQLGRIVDPALVFADGPTPELLRILATHPTAVHNLDTSAQAMANDQAIVAARATELEALDVQVAQALDNSADPHALEVLFTNPPLLDRLSRLRQAERDGNALIDTLRQDGVRRPSRAESSNPNIGIFKTYLGFGGAIAAVEILSNHGIAWPFLVLFHPAANAALQQLRSSASRMLWFSRQRMNKVAYDRASVADLAGAIRYEQWAAGGAKWKGDLPLSPARRTDVQRELGRIYLAAEDVRARMDEFNAALEQAQRDVGGLRHASALKMRDVAAMRKIRDNTDALAPAAWFDTAAVQTLIDQSSMDEPDLVQGMLGLDKAALQAIKAGQLPQAGMTSAEVVALLQDPSAQGLLDVLIATADARAALIAAHGKLYDTLFAAMPAGRSSEVIGERTLDPGRIESKSGSSNSPETILGTKVRQLAIGVNMMAIWSWLMHKPLPDPGASWVEWAVWAAPSMFIPAAVQLFKYSGAADSLTAAQLEQRRQAGDIIPGESPADRAARLKPFDDAVSAANKRKDRWNFWGDMTGISSAIRNGMEVLDPNKSPAERVAFGLASAATALWLHARRGDRLAPGPLRNPDFRTNQLAVAATTLLLVGLALAWLKRTEKAKRGFDEALLPWLYDKTKADPVSGPVPAGTTTTSSPHPTTTDAHKTTSVAPDVPPGTMTTQGPATTSTVPPSTTTTQAPNTSAPDVVDDAPVEDSATAAADKSSATLALLGLVTAQPGSTGSFWRIARDNVDSILSAEEQERLRDEFGPLGVELAATRRLIEANGFDPALMDGVLSADARDPDGVPLGWQVNVNVLGAPAPL